MALLELVFRSFWTFAGFMILLTVLVNGVASIVSALRGKEPSHD